jgi:hypothetical protein
LWLQFLQMGSHNPPLAEVVLLVVGAAGLVGVWVDGRYAVMSVAWPFSAACWLDPRAWQPKSSVKHVRLLGERQHEVRWRSLEERHLSAGERDVQPGGE